MKMEDKIEQIITPIVDELGYEVVRVSFTGGQSRPTLQIMIDNKNQKPIIVDDCVKVSKSLSEILDENIEQEYNLEVSSPGIDRPLTKVEHFERFLGFEARVETIADVENRKRFKGKLLNVKGQNITVEVDGINYDISFDNINKAKLVLNDELIKAYEEDFEDEN